MSNLTIQSVGSESIAVLTSAKDTAQQWAGRIWTNLKGLSRYTQDSRVAVGYLIVATLISFELGRIFRNMFQYFFPITEESVEAADYDHPLFRNQVIELASTLIGCGVTWGALYAFIDRAQLPLRTAVILSVSIPILLLRAYYEYRREQE